MQLEFPKGQSPVVVRQFGSKEELAVWYKDKTGKKLPDVAPNLEKLLELQGNNAIDTFFRIMDSLPAEQTRLNARTNKIELVTPIEHGKAKEQQEVLKKVNEAKVQKTKLEW